jgi:hypothetical protein
MTGLTGDSEPATGTKQNSRTVNPRIGIVALESFALIGRRARQGEAVVQYPALSRLFGVTRAKRTSERTVLGVKWSAHTSLGNCAAESDSTAIPTPSEDVESPFWRASFSYSLTTAATGTASLRISPAMARVSDSACPMTHEQQFWVTLQ